MKDWFDIPFLKSSLWFALWKKGMERQRMESETKLVNHHISQGREEIGLDYCGGNADYSDVFRR